MKYLRPELFLLVFLGWLLSCAAYDDTAPPHNDPTCPLCLAPKLLQRAGNEP